MKKFIILLLAMLLMGVTGCEEGDPIDEMETEIPTDTEAEPEDTGAEPEDTGEEDVDTFDTDPAVLDGLGLTWIDLAGSSFSQGDDGTLAWLTNDFLGEDIPLAFQAHSVTVPSFKMLKTEVTVAQYRACTESDLDGDGEADCEPITGPKCADLTTCEDLEVEGCGNGLTNNFFAGNGSDRDDHPANCTNLYRARQFCKWIGGRLPSESEWEYAARSEGQDILYPWGDTPDVNCDVAVVDDMNVNPEVEVPQVTVLVPDPNPDDEVDDAIYQHEGCGTGTTAPVCSKTDGNTTQGLCDMIGNVFEWTDDCWHPNYNWDEDERPGTGDEAPLDGSAWIDNVPEEGMCDVAHLLSTANVRVAKGGSFVDYSTLWGGAYPNYVHRAASRHPFGEDWPNTQRPTDDYGDAIGFRCVMDVPAP